VRLRAHITFDIDAADFVSAADHQRAVERLLGQVQGAYPQAQLEFRERRQRTDATPMPDAAQARQRTGAVNDYEPLSHAAAS
jgi:hypothetical protein